jgi:hypothetical protein
MTTHSRARRVNVPAYYLGRPAAHWVAALAPRSATHESPGVSCAGQMRRSSPQTREATRPPLGAVTVDDREVVASLEVATPIALRAAGWMGSAR